MGTFQVPPSGLYHYPRSGNSSQTAFSLTAGFKSTAAVLPLEIFPLAGAQGVEIAFGAMLSTADNDAFDYKIWLVNHTYGVDGSLTGLRLDCFGSGTATLGAGTIMGGTAAGATGRIADTVTFTASSVAGSPEGPGAVIQTAYVSAGAAYSPESDLNATVYIPHLGWPDGIIIEFDSTTGDPLGMFALIGRK
jgi:hypothetical protein